MPLQEYQLSAYAPCAPPEGSKLRQVLITVALGAMSQGKWSCAEECLRASGEQLLLLLLYALQHNRGALQQAVMKSGSETAMHTLAMLLLAADARIGLRQALQKDWHLSRCVLLMSKTSSLLAVAGSFLSGEHSLLAHTGAAIAQCNSQHHITILLFLCVACALPLCCTVGPAACLSKT
jgi:hypothetical protein